jgi:hypothetical protein
MAASTVDAAPGKTQEINWIRFDQTTAKDSVRQFAVLLYPFREDNPVIAFKRTSTQKMEFERDTFTDALYFPAGTYRDGEVETDAKFVLIRTVSGRGRKYALANGTYLRCGGREVWRSDGVSSAEGLLK